MKMMQPENAAEIKMKESMMNNPMAMLIVSPEDGRILSANTAAAQFYGWSVERLRKMDIFKINTLPHEALRANFELVLSNQKCAFDFQHRLADGEIRDVEVRIVPVVWENQYALCSLVNDVTERKQAEQVLWRCTEIQNVLRVIAESMASSSSLTEIYQTVHAQVRRVVPADDFQIFLLDEVNPQVVVRHGSGNQGVCLEERQIGKYLPEYVMRKKQAVLVTDDGFERLRSAGEVDHRLFSFKEWVGAPMIDSRGNVFGVVCLMMLKSERSIQPEDVNFLATVASQIAAAIDRIRTENSLRLSEQRLREVVENSVNVIYKRNVETNIYEYLSPALTKILGYDVAEIIRVQAAPLEELVHPDDREEITRWLEIIRANPLQEPIQIEYRLLHKTGHYVWVRNSFNIVRDPRNQQLMRIGSLSDISDRKQMEESLKESEARFRQLIQLLPVPLFYENKSTGELCYVNEQFGKMFGYTLDDIPTMAEWMRVAYPDDKYRHEIQTACEELINATEWGKKEPMRIETRITCKTGRVLSCMLLGISIADYSLNIFMDITELRYKEQLLIASYERRKRNELLDQLIQSPAPSAKLVAECSRLFGFKAMGPFDCFLIVMQSYKGRTREYWREHREVYQPLLDSVSDALATDSLFAWESPDGLCIFSFDCHGLGSVKADQLTKAQSLINTIESEVPELLLSAGVAERVTSLKNLPVHYRQAVTAVSSGSKIWPQQKVFHFLDIGLLQLLPFINDQQQLHEYVERSLGKLLQMDSPKKEKYLITLESILMSDNLKATASQLSVHYKTLVFRKRRIEEILGVSLDNITSRLALLGALQLLKVLEVSAD